MVSQFFLLRSTRYLPLNLGFCQKEGIDAEEYEALTGGGRMGTGRCFLQLLYPLPGDVAPHSAC